VCTSNWCPLWCLGEEIVSVSHRLLNMCTHPTALRQWCSILHSLCIIRSSGSDIFHSVFICGWLYWWGVQELCLWAGEYYMEYYIIVYLVTRGVLVHVWISLIDIGKGRWIPVFFKGHYHWHTMFFYLW